MDDRLLEQIIELRHRIHMNPELSNRETETKETLKAFLREKTGLEIVDCGRWFYAKYSSPSPEKPSIGFRADIDAIRVFEDDTLPYASKNPGVAHKCGHDGHCSALCAFACLVDHEGADRDVYFIFQHAEEEGNGAEECCQVIRNLNIYEIYGLHNYPGREFGCVHTRPGTVNMASVGVEYNVKGTPTHASTPELGKNPAGIICDMVLSLDRIKEEVQSEGLIMATVIQIDIGERAFGVSASHGKLLLTVRGEREEEMNRFLNALNHQAEKACADGGFDLEISYYDRFPDTYNHEESVEKIQRVCAERGIPYKEMEPLRTSEDFGHFLRESKGALVWMGAGMDCPPLHDKDFDYNDNLIEKTCEFFRAILDA